MIAPSFGFLPTKATPTYAPECIFLLPKNHLFLTGEFHFAHPPHRDFDIVTSHFPISRYLKFMAMGPLALTPSRIFHTTTLRATEDKTCRVSSIYVRGKYRDCWRNMLQSYTLMCICHVTLFKFSSELRSYTLKCNIFQNCSSTYFLYLLSHDWSSKQNSFRINVNNTL